jgi:TfoX/Sxy family transcriptional regulator of competence genes
LVILAPVISRKIEGKPMWDSDAKQLQSLIEAALGPVAAAYDMHYRPMFGGIMAYTCGRPFASLSNAGIAVKLPTDMAAKLEEAGGYGLRYKPEDPPSKSYKVIPLALVEARDDALANWLIASMDHCKSLPLKKRKPKKARD